MTYRFPALALALTFALATVGCGDDATPLLTGDASAGDARDDTAGDSDTDTGEDADTDTGETPPSCDMPECDPGETMVDECEADDPLCRSFDACDETYFCLSDGTCDEPVCEDGTRMVVACPDDGSECEEITACGVTIFCVTDVTCDAIPVCDDGDEQVAEGAVCPPDRTCNEKSACGETILCLEPMATECDEPSPCETEQELVGDDVGNCIADSLCYAVKYCGEWMRCTGEGTGCEAATSCSAPAEMTLSEEECRANDDCISRSICSFVAYCAPAE